MNAIVDETTLILTQLFDAPPKRVYDAWLEREQWQAWIGPEGVNCDVPVLNPRVGGRYRVTMHMSSGDVIAIAGVFKVIERPNVLAFTWGRDGDPSQDSLVTLTFKARGNQTELTLRQERLGSVANRDAHAKGWNSALNKLVTYLATGRAPGTAP